MILLVILAMVLMMWALMSRWQKREMYRLWRQLPNKYRTLPFIGHSYMFLGDDEDRMKIFQKLGMEAYATDGLMLIWQGGRLYVNVSDAEVAEIVLKTCLEKDDVMKCSRLLTGNGSVFAPVSIWRPRRKFLAPTFSPKNLLQFAEIFCRQSDVMVDQLRTQAGKGTFSIWKYITTYSMDSVCDTDRPVSVEDLPRLKYLVAVIRETLRLYPLVPVRLRKVTEELTLQSTIDVQVKTQFQPSHPFLKAFEEVLKIDAARICQPWLHNDTFFKMTPIYKVHTEHRTTIYEFINRIIKSKRQALQEELEVRKNKAESEQCAEVKPKTFLELLIDSTGDGRAFSNLELQEECLVLVLAGTDTTAVGTAFTALMLARHPDVQEKVYQEIKEIFGDTDRPVTVEDLPRLKYLDAVIRETLRLYPSVPVILRKVTKELTLPSGITLVKDCGIVINIWAIHRNPKYWGEDAMEFRPERFIDSPPKHPAAFVAFSHGPRGCIGYRYAMMSMKTAVSALVRQYRLLPSESLQTNAPLRVKFDVMMKHVDNFELQLESRH